MQETNNLPQNPALQQTAVSGSFHPVLLKYKKWREENDEDYCYDQVHEFFADLTRSKMMSFMDWCLKNCH
jgi:hypothetical protein